MSDAAPLSIAVENKTLALFLDGTWYVDENNTNVWRLYSLCAARDAAGRKQVCYYTKGVGTSYGEVIRGGMFGYGIDALIKNAYEWLIAHYDPGDKLFVFGFSRGAYAARSLAGLVARCGIPRPGSPIGIAELFARSLEGDARPTLLTLRGQRAKRALKGPSLLEEWMLDYCFPADVTMVGVWDTVGALRGAAGYRETGRRPIQHAFHALAIDEHRPTFAPTLWTTTVHRDRPAAAAPPPRPLASVEQRWFAGAHANVGGGYNSDLLAQLPLRWLMEKAGALGLAFRETVDLRGAGKADAVYGGTVADPFRTMGGGAYYLLKLGRPHLRPIGAPAIADGAREIATVNETIDASVFERWRRNPTYRPANLAAWAARRGVKVEDVAGPVSAADPARPLGGGPEGSPLAPAGTAASAAIPAASR